MLNGAYKYYVLGMLTLVYTMNFIDRNLIILLLQPIKEDLHLSDTQLGFVTGITFGLFYAVVGLPVARIADRGGNRSTITSVAIALWGCTVMVCLVVSSFVQLVFARVAAAVGEAGCMPPTYSLLGDYFPDPAERIRAMAVYWLGVPLSALISLIAGGWLNERYGWRFTMFAMGVPALVVAVVFKMTVADPRKRAHTQFKDMRVRSMIGLLATLWRQESSRHLSVAIVLLFSMSSGLAPWYGAFMMRSHGMGTAELGLWLGLIFGSSGIVGSLLGGYVTGRWFSTNERGQMRLIAILIAALVPCHLLFLLLPHKHQALLAMSPLGVVFVSIYGPTFALLQRLVPDDMRATTLAVVMMLANLIGMGVGPQIVGILSDLLAPVMGLDSLRYAMLVVSLVAVWAAYHFWRVGQTVTADLAALPANHRAAIP